VKMLYNYKHKKAEKGKKIMNDKFLKKLDEKLKKQIANRGNFTLKDLPHPHKLKNVEKAAKRIVENLLSGKRMLIIGDYDADGIFATTILMKFFTELGFSGLVDYKIPSRLKDGYGLNKTLIDYAIENGFNFVVTVDNGIAANEAIDYANSKNYEVIITDHHTPPATLPNAEIIVNPRVQGEESEVFQYISGATVAWYLAYAVQLELGSKIDLKEYLDFVALTVISDVMPLENINVPLVNYGIKLLKERKRDIYKFIWNDWTAPVMDTTSIAFSLIPMINAMGRIDDANVAVSFFLDDRNTYQNYMYMYNVNEKRKAMSREQLMKAELITANSNDKAIVIKDECHEGIIGIIAGKLAEKYHKPTYVFTYNKEKKIYKGSGRTTGNIHLYDLTNKASDLLIGFGGHSGAVGLAVSEENFEKFKKRILEEVEKIDKKDFISESSVPMECSFDDISPEMMNTILKYAPFGQGNPAPIFKTKADVAILTELKDGLHYKCLLTSPKTEVIGLFFNVEKDKFLQTIEVNEKQEFIFSPGLAYNAKDSVFSIELKCDLI
jgi:single-stranded-DNA-specific exonuclease recJ